MSTALSMQLARLVHAVRFEALAPEVVHQCKRLLLDTLGCALAAHASAPARIAREVASLWSGARHASIVGEVEKCSAPLATLVNATLVRYFDSNDYYFGADSAHPSNNIPAALAVAQHKGRGGRDVITAMVIGYEIHIGLCDAVAPPGISGRGWHTATHLQFASAALASRLLCDDEAVTANALAIAGSHNNCLAEAQRGDIPLMKATAEAYVSKNAVEAAYLAAAGLTGPQRIFEGPCGWTRAVAASLDYGLLGELFCGERRIMRSCLKPYPAVAGAMAPIQAVLDLGIPRARLQDVDRVVVKLPAAVAKKAADPEKLRPRDKETADHSMHYCVAVSLLDGACGHEQFTDARIRSSDVADMIAKVSIVADDDLSQSWPGASGGGIALSFSDGTSVQKVLGFPPGHPRNPLSDGDIERKFLGLVHDLLPRSQAQNAIDAIWGLDRCTNIDRLFAPLVLA
ncbi:MAG: MmgE/PrpD family protein [Burkholderiales bacterium]|nr:MmgE/PrpD family protein [Burkholderiales bacterium]